MSDVGLMFACQACAIGYHWECVNPVEKDGSFLCCCSYVAKGIPADEDEGGAERAITNNLTTGRKRAGRLAPIFPGMTCEFAGLRYAGGGIVPIVGCDYNRIAKVKKNSDLPEGSDARGELHHGPDKTTLNNGPMNLHRICANCHSRWHALNDEFYPDERPGPEEQWLPVDGDRRCWPHDNITEATAEEIAESDAWWALRTEKRPDYPFGR